MSDEPCSWCAHYKTLAAGAESRHCATFALYVTYYKQTLAQAKGIKRLRKQIARLKAEKDAEIARLKSERDWALSTNGITHGVYGELYAARAEIARLREDAERGQWMIKNSSWMRKEVESHGTKNTWLYFRVPVLVDADLSCQFARRAAIDAARKEGE